MAHLGAVQNSPAGFLQATASRMHDLLCLVYLLLSAPDLSDSSRGIQVIRELIADREHSITSIGHRMSRWRASAALSAAAAATDATIGIESLRALHRLLPEVRSVAEFSDIF